MKLIVRRLRGIVSIGLTWSVVWALGGLSYVAVRLYIDRPAVDVSILMRLAVIGGVIYGVYGFTTGALFTSALAMAERRRTLEQLRMIRIAGWGGIAGAVLPVLILVLSFALEGSAAPVLWSLGFVGFGAALGAASAAVTLGAARSKQPQLEAPGT